MTPVELPVPVPAARTLVRALVFLIGLLAPAAALAQINVSVATEQQLRDAIVSINNTSPAQTNTVTFTASITLTRSLPYVRRVMVLEGANLVLDANNTGRAFMVLAGGNVTIRNLTIRRTRAQGGNGGNGQWGGGGGFGGGAALFLDSGAIVNTLNVVIDGAVAVGGNGGTGGNGSNGGGGGGGLGGNGGSATAGGGSGGGGGYRGNGGNATSSGGGGGGGEFGNGGNGGTGGGGGGGQIGNGGAGSAGGGGEGGGAISTGAGASGATGGAGLAAEGGDGGNSGAAGSNGSNGGGGGGGGVNGGGGEGRRSGGGGGGGANAAGNFGGSAGGGGGGGAGAAGGVGQDFAGGGGGATVGGDAGFGGGGGGGAAGGSSSGGTFGGGAGASNGAPVAAGGAADALHGGGGGSEGGAIVVREGGVLTMTQTSFTGVFSVTAGQGGGGTATAGLARGTHFFHGGGGDIPVTFDVPTGQTIPITGNDAFTGGGDFAKAGGGRLRIDGINQFPSGRFTLTAGQLALVNDFSLGDPSVTPTDPVMLFVGNGGTLEGEGAPRTFANDINLLAGGLTIGGTQDVTLTGDISGVGILTMAAAGHTLTLPVTAAHSGGTRVAAGTLPLSNQGQLGSGGVFLAGGTLRPTVPFTFNRTLTLEGTGSIFDIGTNATTWSGSVVGAGSVTKTGSATLILSGVNTFSGLFTVGTGILSLQGGSAVGDLGTLGVSAGASAVVTATETMGGLAGAGPVSLAGGSVLTLAGPGTTTYSGVLSGSASLVKSGLGTQVLSGTNTYSGATTVSGGTLRINGSIASTTVSVTGGILGGAGTVQNITATSGRVSPDGTMVANGNVNIGAGAGFGSTINGTTPGTFGQLDVQGTVAVGGSLAVTVNVTPSAGSSFILIDNDGADPIIGTFTGLPEGQLVEFGGVQFRISYVAGTGNDLGLTSVMFVSYLAEGATNNFFNVRLALINPSAVDTAAVTVRFLKSDATTATTTLSMPPLSRRSIDPKTVNGVGNADFSVVVESSAPVVVDRTMSWDASGYGSHAETASGAPATEWYFAEGATHGQFELFYLLQNSSDSAAVVEISYLRPTPAPPIVKSYNLAAHSRRTIYVDQEDPALAATDVSAVIRSTNGVPISTERSMYLSTPSQAFAAGTAVGGLRAPATSWFFAEGATGSFFDFFLLLANPSATTAANVQVTYSTSFGQQVVRNYTVAPNSRRTISVEQEDPLLANSAVAATVTSTNGVGVLAERAIYWPAFPWYEGHAAAGVIATGTRWALAEGEVGGAAETQTYILVANTGASAATVRVTILLETGGTTQRDFNVPANSRFNVNVGVEFPAVTNARFGAIVESLGGSPMPLVVERSMYSNANGVVWAAGTNAVGTRLQ